nr:mRNA surveillance protein Pelota [Desulfurococcales archaeon]
MRISVDRERLSLRIDFEEDLWHLRFVLRPGDIVEGLTFRSISIGGRRVEKKQVRVKLRVKQVEFQPFTGRLRVFGVIVEGPEEYGLRGKHHAMTIGVGQSVTITREGGWPASVVDRLRGSGPRGRALIVAVDYEEYAIALLSPVGFRVLVEGYSRLPGKDDPAREEATLRFISSVAGQAVEYSSKSDATLIVVVGPGNLKNEVASKIRKLSPKTQVYVDSASMGGRAGVEEAIRRPNIIGRLRGYYILEAEDFLSRFLSLVARDPERVAQGVEEVARMLELGAVDTVAFTESIYYSQDPGVLEKILELAHRSRANTLMVP